MNGTAADAPTTTRRALAFALALALVHAALWLVSIRREGSWAQAPATGTAPPPQSSGPGARFKRPEPYAPVGDVPTEPPAPTTAPSPAPKAPPPRPVSNGLSQGLVIQDVPPGSMLERIGLQPGDVVRSVNGEAVSSEADVARVLQQRGMQGSFTAEVQRGGMTVPIAVSGQR